MADIEDGFDIRDINEARKLDEVQIKIRKRDPVELGQMDSFVPGTTPVWVKTWGCSHNASDSEYMAGILAKAGYPIVKKSADAKIWVLNSCTVKTPSETQASNLLEEGRKLGKFVVMAGCVSQAAPDEQWLKNVSIVGVKQIDRILEVVEETLKGNTVRLLSRKRPDAGLSLPKMRKNDLVEVLAINTGCLNHCTYCKTKMARGDLKSYPLEELVEQARTAFERDGVKELWLTSEDLGAWGRDIGMVLPDLLNELVKVIPNGCMMRLGMTNPPYILDYLEEIAAVLNHPRVYSFLHIPVQSGSDAVLRDMKREYSSDHFRTIMDFMLKNVPNIYIATDMICAFPTETDEDFEESMQLVRDYKFPSLFINQFYPRSGTPAARMKKIDTVEARRRTAAMSALFREYSRYTPERIGEEHDVLVCEMATDGVHAVGHNKCYEHFLVPYYNGLMGTWVRVRIVEVAKFHMRSELCKKPSEEGTANGAVLTDWTAKKLDDCKPIGTFKAGEMISTPAPIEKSPIAVIVLSVPLVIGMILWYFIGI
ncbi:hypothetical protein Y032_0005g2578 [Ancylostoma ceylanicum]|uniref:tRNA-t(6)A37 methylthiotransferase n=2 Tax=Ancylostoma ceylanicum TaxID=53326 RepID=A0A016VU74_9BILA|nr:hypothetical protein Y032_0005g2578 [Ancylostoma ceylanicum]